MIKRDFGPEPQGVFNKEAMITKMLAESSAAEVAWLWWVDIDTLIVNATAAPPLETYDGRDFVAWGHAETLLQGDMQNGAPPDVRLQQDQHAPAV